MHTLQHSQPHHPVLTPVFLRGLVWVRTHPRAVKHTLRVGLAGLAGFTVLNLGLFAVQNGRTSAFTSINGKAYGLMSLEDAKQVLETEHAQSQLTLSIGSKTVMLNAKQSGVDIDADQTFTVLTNKAGLERLPLVSALGDLFVSIKPVFHVDQQALAAKLAPFVTDEMVPAQNAEAVIPSDPAGPVTITPETNGRELNAAIAAEQVAEWISGSDFTIKITDNVLFPKWTVQDMEAFMPAIEAARRTSMTVQAGDNKLALTSELLASMLRVNTKGTDLKMTLDADGLKAYLDQQSQLFYTAPIATRTVQKDGTEISRTEGTAGKQLDTTATTKLAVTAFENNILTVVPALSTVDPEVVIARTYSNTDTGLYKLIEDFAKSHNGAYRIAAVELAGPGHRSAFYEADTPIATASTYKPFIAYGIMQRIEAGTLTLEDPTSIGTVGYCMRRMLVISDNYCAAALQSLLGWADLDSKLQNDGFTATRLNNYSGGYKYSTARDEASLLARIYNHELVNAGSADYIIDLMKQQIYHKGIEAGSRGAVVAAKAGYIDGFYHDIGIVYSPKSTYILVLLTNGAGSYTNLRLLSEQVYDFYNQ